jgi:hypothetical protein
MRRIPAAARRDLWLAPIGLIGTGVARGAARIVRARGGGAMTVLRGVGVLVPLALGLALATPLGGAGRAEAQPASGPGESAPAEPVESAPAAEITSVARGDAPHEVAPPESAIR